MSHLKTCTRTGLYGIKVMHWESTCICFVPRLTCHNASHVNIWLPSVWQLCKMKQINSTARLINIKRNWQSFQTCKKPDVWCLSNLKQQWCEVVIASTKGRFHRSFHGKPDHFVDVQGRVTCLCTMTHSACPSTCSQFIASFLKYVESFTALLITHHVLTVVFMQKSWLDFAHRHFLCV